MAWNYMANTQAKEWLKSGYYDLKIIEYIINDDMLTHIVAFHSQQAIEKTLKSILENEVKKIPKIHKLQHLITKIDINIEWDESIIEILDELYIDSRYPGDLGLLPHGKPTLNDAKKFYNFAQNIFDKVCKILNVEISEIYM